MGLSRLALTARPLKISRRTKLQDGRQPVIVKDSAAEVHYRRSLRISCQTAQYPRLQKLYTQPFPLPLRRLS